MSTSTVTNLVAGSTDVTVDVSLVQDADATSPGNPITGLLFNSASLTCYYRRGATGTSTQLTLATQTVGGAHSDGGFVEIDATNKPGQYRLDLSDAIVATGVDVITVTLNGATDLATHTVYIYPVPAVPTNFALLSIDSDGNVTTDAETLKRATLSAGSASGGTFSSAPWTSNNDPVGQTAIVKDGTGVEQSRQIATFTQATGAFTVSPDFTTALDATSVVTVVGSAPASTVNLPSVDVISISGDSTAADNLESDYDGTGYAKTNSTVGTVTTVTGGATSAEIAALNDISVSDVLTTQMTEAYAADGVAPTLAQALFLIQQLLGDFSISGTTLTMRRLDGSTTAATFTLNDAGSPTGITRAT